ncbi:PAS domain-containing protein [Catalinimonas sp. 4WD22]|uniref:PAS domain-containing sensor histidine kinase n=1 Tax=Catalinimonas locisalis TaxID=3133978 RepID=UPI003100CC18
MKRQINTDSNTLKAFENIPDLYIVLSPDLQILTASNAYLSVFNVERDEIVHKHLLEIFPNHPDAPQARTIDNLLKSLENVLATRKPHHMDVQRYDISSPSGKLERKYWQPFNFPVLNDDNEIMYIIHKTVDITKQVNDQEYIQELSEREKEALDEAKWHHKRYTDFIMQAPIAISFFMGKDHIIKLVNPLMCNIMGREADDIVEKPLFDALPELVGQGYENVLAEVYKTGEAIEFKESPATLMLDHKLIQGFYHTVYQPVKNTRGNVIGIINIVTNVTKQVEARKKIEDSERQLRLITNAMPVLIGYLDQEEKYRFANQTYKSWFNQNPEDLIGLPVRDVIGNKAYERVKKYIDRAKKGEKVDFEAKMPYRDDFVKHIKTSYIPDIQDAKVLGFFTLVTDITDHVEARHQLELRENYFRMMADNVPVMIWVTQPDGSCTYLNKRWYDFTGQSKESSLGYGWLSTVHPDDVARSERLFLQANEEQKSFEFIYRLKSKNGEYRWAIDSGLPKFNEEGKFEGFVGCVIDIHERQLSEEAMQKLSLKLAKTNDDLSFANEQILASNEELALSNQQLSYINADMDNFIYTASHDLRAPISNIEGLMDAMEKNLSSESRQAPLINKLLGMITDSINRFKNTLDDLTQISRIQREEHTDISEVSISRLIHEVMLDLSSKIEEAGAVFDINIKEDTLLHFSAKNARSIVYNLVSNAIKYRSEHRKPLIKISSFQQEEHLILTIEDNGLGMGPSEENKIFAMFKRLHDHVEGTGVGLYIVKKIIENAGGKIEVQSTLHQGSIFRVYFRQNPQIQ